ncbi:uncharacterized protein K452DRAFT_284163 [Aplosporella prunicola CBS 121167]|uniref:Inclusion body clearance protein IML2 n=1 Tax=Aplosporella prunicola CBS 121167 TaxID=1176127 RepID=A0A6A6BNU9_9PEZI|nr:uncharacterized protein K452DRAFT_284163 [Aplosporella prunicola CBS 121167]KAF2145782.1 hypothetical protein K452DRAFT_284163 [Aplosporella prunicola CBS 121167]
MPLGSWLGGKGKAHLHGSTHSLSALDEPQQLEDAIRAVSHIMNDDVETADKLLGDGASPFHKLGKGVVVFMRATLGFEQDVMKEASDVLSTAENSAYDHHRKAQRHSPQSSIYPAGSEFASCLAQAQLMSAIVGVLNESLTESIRGFYKLRKAFIALDAIMEAEKAKLEGKSVPGSSRVSLHSEVSKAGSASGAAKSISASSGSTLVKDDELALSGAPKGELETDTPQSEKDEFYDADEAHEGVPTPPVYEGHLDIKGHIEVPPGALPSYKGSPAMSTVARDLGTMSISDDADGPDPEVFNNDTTDIFIHSGANMCFGILMLVISLIPPAFATLLKIVGFKGDRQRGISMLWQATKFNNIYGGLAGLVILGYYNGMVGFCDIVPESGEGSYPKERCKALLAEMRRRYPQSHLWMLEDARMLASDKELEQAIEVMKKASKSQLKQVEALQWFERSLDHMYAHQYEECSHAFQTCVTLNNWSHGLYYYIAGCAHVELYRSFKAASREDVNASKLAQEHKDKAEKLLKLVPQHTGKKRFMARQLPFDIFVNRKLQKWERRAAEWKCDFIDAIGVSPIEEVIYFWNGYKRMRPEHLQRSLDALAWSTSPGNNPHWEKEGLDEHAILSLLKATALRNLKYTAEAKDLLLDQIISHDWQEFKGQFKDNWTCPAAHYEMAANLWQECESGAGAGAGDAQRLKECSVWLEKVARWESYDLDTRIGLKVTTARDTLRSRGVETAA